MRHFAGVCALAEMTAAPLVPCRITGEFRMTAIHDPAIKQKLGTVGKGVFDGISVKILINKIAPIMAAAESLGSDGPAILHPATLVNVVNQEITVTAPAGPKKGMKAGFDTSAH